jgi:hypothetical protein
MSKAIKSMLLGSRALLHELSALEIPSSNIHKRMNYLRSINPCSKMLTGQINTVPAIACCISRRPLSSSSTNTDVTQDDLNKARFVRFFAAIFILTAGLRVAPNAAASTVDHTVMLLDAEERMLVSAGLSRLNMLLRMDAVKRRSVECGALPRLLGLIDSAVVEGGKVQNDIGMFFLT